MPTIPPMTPRPILNSMVSDVGTGTGTGVCNDIVITFGVASRTGVGESSTVRSGCSLDLMESSMLEPKFCMIIYIPLALGSFSNREKEEVKPATDRETTLKQTERLEQTNWKEKYLEGKGSLLNHIALEKANGGSQLATLTKWVHIDIFQINGRIFIE